ncbi:MAG TPA: hypothetical protein ENO20_04425 [Bacteroides sp.]|nr:hypothetical protein [Bacteroides sp.]
MTILLLASFPLYGQFNTYSPYTRFGLGDLVRGGFPQNLAMGGTGIAIHENNRINYLNPASFAALDSTSVYFDFGANTFHNQYMTENYSNTWWNMNLHHVAFATSVGKYLGLSAGIVPFSSIGYNIKQEYNDYVTGDAMDVFYKGDGGIMNFYLGAALKLFDRVSVGASMNYLLGRLTRERMIDFPIQSTYSVASSLENLDLKKPLFTLGMQYKEVVGDKFFFTLGGTHTLKANVGSSMQYSVTNTIYGTSAAYVNDTVTVNPLYQVIQDTLGNDFTMPSRTGVGLALGIPGKLIITGDYVLQDWTGVLSGENYSLTNASSLHLGVEFTPDVEALRGYHKLMTYRVGGYHSNYYLMVNGHQLEDNGITFGVGLPVRSLKSSFNVAFTLGTRGTTDDNLIKENYGIITFNVTLHDLWFRKRRYD